MRASKETVSHEYIFIQWLHHIIKPVEFHCSHLAAPCRGLTKGIPRPMLRLGSALPKILGLDASGFFKHSGKVDRI